MIPTKCFRPQQSTSPKLLAGTLGRLAVAQIGPYTDESRTAQLGHRIRKEIARWDLLPIEIAHTHDTVILTSLAVDNEMALMMSSCMGSILQIITGLITIHPLPQGTPR